MKRLINLGIALLFSGIFLFWPAKIFAANLYLWPSSNTYGLGQTISVSVMVDTQGESVNAASVRLAYPQDKLQAVWISSRGSAFDVGAAESFGGGLVKIDRGKIPPPVTGQKLVAIVGFKVAATGEAALSINSDSKVLRHGDSSNVLTGTGTAKFTLVEKVEGPTPTPTIVKVPPVISDLKVVEVGTNSAQIAWKTDKPSSSIVEYGINEESASQFPFSARDERLVIDHQVILDSRLLQPATTYHFRVASTDETGAEVVSDTQTFKTKGFSAEIKVHDKKGQPLKGVKVTVSSEPQTQITNEEGIAVFEDLEPGKHMVVLDFGGKSISETIILKAVPEPQSFEFSLEASPKINPLFFALPILFILVILLVLIVLKKKMKQPETPMPPKDQDENQTESQSTAPMPFPSEPSHFS